MVKKKKAWKRFTEEENEILLNMIKEKGPIQGCREAAAKLENRSTSTLVNHYYQILIKKPTIIVTDRIRVYRPRKPRVLGAPKVSQITYVMRKMLELKPEERTKILNFFK